MIPKGWSSQKLSSVASIIDCKHRTPEYVKSGIPLVSPGTIKWGALDLISPVKRVTEEEYRSLMDHCVVEQGDLVMSRNQSVGVVSYVDSKKPFVLGQDTVLIKAIHADWRFIYYTLQSDLVQRQIAKSAGGSTFSRINLSDIRALNIKTPAICEQDKISQILTAWDKAISVTEKLLTNSQQQKKALMQQLLTGKKRLLNENGVRFSGKWIWLRAAELFKTISQKNNSEDEELLAVTQDLGVIPRSMLERRVVMPDGSTKGYKLVVSGNFIISLRSFQGGLEYSRYRGLVSPAYTVLTPIKKIVDEFYMQYYKSYDFIGHLAVAVIGIRDGKQISYEDFSFLKLPYPEIEEQQKIATVLSAADDEIATLEKKLACLRDEKKALMQQLLTGKRRVKVDEAVAE